MDDLPIDKIQIPGPTLASLLHHLTTSSCDISGLLFGTISSSPTTLSDDPTNSSTTPIPSSTTTITATVTSFLSFPSFYSSAGQINLLSKSYSKSLIGWFSGRRKTPLRPSLRENTVSSNLSAQFSLSPTLFLLLTTPPPQEQQQQQQSPPPLIHTHDYRFFHLRISGQCRMEPKSVEIINIGPAFRGQYDNYCSNSLFPDVACGNSMVAEEDNNGDQEKLDMCAEGFDVGRLNQLTGSVASGYTGELEDLYSKMLVKLNGLARLVEKSSARVLEQETQNMKFRYKVAGLE